MTSSPEKSHAPTTLLSGVRVLDLTAVVMGPLATRMLADMGAEVIRVEPPGGDVIRQYEPMRSPAMGAFAMNLNRNKRSVMLDLKTPTGREAMADLVASSDVFVSTLRRSALERLGLDAETCRSVRPDLIHCVANGFGSDGPHGDRAAYDDVIQAASGMASMFAWTGGEPQLIPTIAADKITGTHIAFAIAAALHSRAVTGEGATLEVPMGETMAAFNLVEHLGGHTFDPPEGPFSYQRVITPHRRPRRSRDGWIVILPYSRTNWLEFFAEGGRPDLGEDTRFETTAGRVTHADALYATMDEIVGTKTTAEWIEFCTRSSIPVSEVVELSEIDQHEHYSAVGLIESADHPTEGPYRYVRDTIMVDGAKPALRHHAPRLGADTNSVMTELGWSNLRIAALE